MTAAPARPPEVSVEHWDEMGEEEQVLCSRFFALLDIMPDGEPPMLLSLSMH
tara:strand:+ start:1724 stop:1879 length:156 start_codon:yes stop_codon:yes gene_type:complete